MKEFHYRFCGYFFMVMAYLVTFSISRFRCSTYKRESATDHWIPTHYLGAFGPAVGAIYSMNTLKGRKEVKLFLKSFLSLKFSWKLWLAIFLILGLTNILAWYLPELFGYERLPILLPNIYIFPLYWLIMVLLGGGQEEIGWRGYIMPFLKSKYGLWIGNIMLGFIWAVWHIPLWFVSVSTQQYMPFNAFLIGCIGLSFFYLGSLRGQMVDPYLGLLPMAHLMRLFLYFLPLLWSWGCLSYVFGSMRFLYYAWALYLCRTLQRNIKVEYYAEMAF
jgi:uncharacterized protein